MADRMVVAGQERRKELAAGVETGRRKASLEARQSPEICLDDIPDQVLEYLFDEWVARQLSGVKLTRLQRAVYEMHLRGLSVAEIAVRIGQRRQQVSTTILLARKRAVRRRPDKYDGLQQVYWQEVRRYIYRKPRHGWGR